MYRFLILLIAGVCAMTSLPAHAQDREVPYWASIRAEVLNMRVGPSQDYRIEWVYKRKGLPMKVVRVMEGWRLVQDPDGAQGWVVARLLNPSVRRSLSVKVSLRSVPNPMAHRRSNGTRSPGSSAIWAAARTVIASSMPRGTRAGSRPIASGALAIPD